MSIWSRVFVTVTLDCVLLYTTREGGKNKQQVGGRSNEIEWGKASREQNYENRSKGEQMNEWQMKWHMSEWCSDGSRGRGAGEEWSLLLNGGR